MIFLVENLDSIFRFSRYIKQFCAHSQCDSCLAHPAPRLLSTSKMIHCGTIDRSVGGRAGVRFAGSLFLFHFFFAHTQTVKNGTSKQFTPVNGEKMKNSRLIFHRQGRPCWRKPLPRWGHLRCGVHYVVHLQERNSPRARDLPLIEDDGSWRWAGIS